MKVIIAGSRDIHDCELLKQAIKESGFDITHLVSGGAPGVDTLAEEWAREQQIPITIYFAQWKKYGKRAGILRNEIMAKNADALIALRLNNSKGTSHMISESIAKKLPVFVIEMEIDLDETFRPKRSKIWATNCNQNYSDRTDKDHMGM